MRLRPLALASVIAALACASCTSAQQGSGSVAPAATSTAPTSSTPSPTPPSIAESSRAPSPTPSPAVPPLSAQARAAGLVDVRTVVPDAVIDLRYATTDNFTSVQLYPRDARCLVHRTMVDGLVTAARKLRALGDVLVFWDCYRPHAVQVRMFEVVPNPDWVARPGPYATSHESARSVDVTVGRRVAGGGCPQRVQGHCLLDMGTGFDDFTPRAWAFATQGVSTEEQANRAVLRHAMNAGGLSVYSGEWWHFDGPGALVRRAILDVPVN
jgi:D-alanyl-D-alanine dipeptidase